MKRIALGYLLCLFALTALSQKKATISFSIDGTIGGLKEGTDVYLIGSKEVKGRGTVDDTVSSVKSSKQRFMFSGTATDAGTPVRIAIKEQPMPLFLFLGNDQVKLNGNISQWPEVEITGSPFTRQYRHYADLELNLMTKLLGDKENFQKTRDSFIEENKHQPIAAYAVARAGRIGHGDNWDVQRMGAFYNNLSKEVKFSYWGKQLAEKVENMRMQAELLERMKNKGAIPAFNLREENGKIVNIKDLVAKNKYTLIDFYSSGCPACVEAVPGMTDALKAFASQGFGVIGISIDHSSERWIQTLNRFYRQVPWKNYLDVEQTYINIFNGLAVPGYLLVDSELKVVAMDYLTPLGPTAPKEESTHLGANLKEALKAYF